MGRVARALDAAELLPFLEGLNCQGTLYVAFSGGLDSTALLLAFSDLRDRLAVPIHAIHINHGVHPQAPRWAAHCERLCESLKLPLTVSDAPEPALAGDNPEARLRAWRLGVFESLLGPDDVICTAHHRQDQAETLLLALLRGSGVRGLAAMPPVRPLGAGRLARPLLGFSRESLEAFVATRGVACIDDPSNLDTRMDRNFLRHELMPLLEQRWPAAEKNLAKSATLLGQTGSLLAAEGTLALAGRVPQPGVLRVQGLYAAHKALAEILRHWLRSQEVPPLPGQQLDELLAQLGNNSPDQRIECRWAGHRLLHAAGLLWLDPATNITLPEPLPWDGRQPLALGPAAGQLSFSAPPPDFTGELRRRAGGERLHRSGSAQSTSLKRWLAARALPHWFRSAVPLLYCDDQLVAVGDCPVDRAFKERLKRQRTALQWTPGDAQLRWAWEECRRDGLRVN